MKANRTKEWYLSLEISVREEFAKLNLLIAFVPD